MATVGYLYSDPLIEAMPDPADLGWQVERLYRDLSRDRPQLQQLLADCREGKVNCVTIRRLEDLGETLWEVGDRLAEFEALGIEAIAGQGTDIAKLNGNPGDLMHLLAEIQATQRSRHICQGHARNRLKALPPPGKAPYGYRRGKDRYALDRTAASVVRDFFEQFLLYGSLRGAVRHLEEKWGKKISATTGRKWLTSPAYRGDLAYRDGRVMSDTHMPILSREEAAQVDRLLRRNQRMPPRTASAPRSLAGLVLCGECGSPHTVTRVTAHRHTREYLYLRPRQCSRQPKCKAVAYDRVLHETITRICEDLPQAVAKLHLPDMGGIETEMNGAIATKQQALAQLPDLCDRGILDAATAELRTYTLRAEIAQLQSKLAQLPPVNLRETAAAVSIPQFWLDLTEFERRFYFREFIRHIELHRQGEDWTLRLAFIF